MGGQVSPKILGATAIGLALILGAYTMNSINNPPSLSQPAATTEALKAAPRVAIAVTDEDQNGIEDWRDEFVTTKPIVLDDFDAEDYTLPETLTGQMSIDLFAGILESKVSGPFGDPQEEIIARTVDGLAEQTEQTLYTVADISVIDEWDENDVVNYANTVAASVDRHLGNLERNEVEILNEAVLEQRPEVLAELQPVSEGYRGVRDDLLRIPVPQILRKEHIDLLNTFEAVYTDIEAMQLVFTDPIVSVMRLKRYEGNREGLLLAQQYLLEALEPYTTLFESDDPALLFVQFATAYQGPN